MRRAAKTDANHQIIRAGLRRIPGVTVKDTSNIGGGWVDLVVGYKRRTVLMEVKDGQKPKSAQKLTYAQREFADNWTGSPIFVVASLDQAVDVLMKETQ